MDLNKILFPHDEIRDSQDRLVSRYIDCLENRRHLIAHAPTGIGKTSLLGPALSYALEKDLTVFFLTSRHTQHELATETLRLIKQRFGVKFVSTSLIGKKWMCSFDGVHGLSSGEFSDFCKNMVQDGKCSFYINSRSAGKLTPLGKNIIEQLKVTNPNSTESVIGLSKDNDLCSYEIALELAKNSSVIITDYFYLFSPQVRKNFLSKIGKEMGRCMIIIDEGHNLPARIRELMSSRLTTNMIERAVKEAKKFGYEETIGHLVHIQDSLNSISRDMGPGNEKLVRKEDFIIGDDYDEVVSDIKMVGESVREAQKQSYISGISAFLEMWQAEDQGFVRILSVFETRKGPLTILTYKCLDPSVITSEIISSSYQTTIMSGTLSPTDTYKDLLGFPDSAEMIELSDPFPERNRLNLIVPLTSTKFRTRSKAQYEKIANICAEIANEINGNIALFFPSYGIRDEVYPSFKNHYRKKIFLEDAKFSKDEKIGLLEKFKKEKDRGSALMAVSAANFGEGIDLPGDLLKAVIVIGLPLQKPDLETRELIRYYDEKFSSGWEYGYVFPAFTKTLQTAGRCIRNEKDRGVIVFLDERYAWKNYIKNFPKEWEMIITEEYTKYIHEFYNNTL